MSHLITDPNFLLRKLLRKNISRSRTLIRRSAKLRAAVREIITESSRLQLLMPKQLDLELIREARLLIDGANVHRVKEMIFVYQQAVELHNRGHRAHKFYQEQFELQLRAWVNSKRKAMRAQP